MESIIEMLFDAANKNRIKSCYEQDILNNIDKASLLLKRHLSKKEKRLLLSIVDNKGLLLEDAALRNFAVGLKLGIKLGAELDKE